MIGLNQLEKARLEIDQCDEAIVENFEKRMELVMDVLHYKRKEGLPIFQPEREQRVIEKVLLSCLNADFHQEIQELYREIMRISRKMQSRKLFPYNISLIGFMGTGKSSIAKELAEKLEMPFVDMDILIQQKTNMTIEEIFEKKGEIYFREIERNTLKELSENNNMIISCGGGVVLNKENILNLKKNSKIVLLEATPSTIFQRLQNDGSRPLLKGEMNISYIENMLLQRKTAYDEAADITIATDDKSFDEISKEVVKSLLDKYK